MIEITKHYESEDVRKQVVSKEAWWAFFLNSTKQIQKKLRIWTVWNWSHCFYFFFCLPCDTNTNTFTIQNMSAVAPVTRSEILSLYRQFLRYSNKFEIYNFREYFIRKSRNEFKKYKDITEVEKARELLDQAKKDLLVIKRQSTISQMYHFDKLVVERVDDDHHLSKKHSD